MKVQTHCNRTGNKMVSLVYGINAPSTDRGRPEVLLKRFRLNMHMHHELVL